MGNDRREEAGQQRVTAVRRSNGAIAQLGERLICIQEVSGSIPLSSTNFCVSRCYRVRRLVHYTSSHAA